MTGLAGTVVETAPAAPAAAATLTPGAAAAETLTTAASSSPAAGIEAAAALQNPQAVAEAQAKWASAQAVVAPEAVAAAPAAPEVTTPPAQLKIEGRQNGAEPPADQARAPGTQADDEPAGHPATETVAPPRTEPPTPKDAKQPEQTPMQKEYARLTSEKDALLKEQEVAKAEGKELPDEKKDRLTQLNQEIAGRDRHAYLNGRVEKGNASAEEKQELVELDKKYGVKPSENPWAGKTRGQVQTDLETHYKRLVDKGEISQEDANRKIQEGLKEYDDKNPEATEDQSETAEQSKKRLDEDVQKIQEELSAGKITPQQAAERLNGNMRAREQVVNLLVSRLEKGDQSLTSFEREVAKNGAEMQRLMYEIMYAPRVVKQMEITLQKLKDEYKNVKNFKITEQNANSADARENVQKRAMLANQIAAQAAHMARYVNIVGNNVNEFISTNSRLENLIGARIPLYNMVIQIGTGLRRRSSSYMTDARARVIARTGKTI